MLRCGIEAKQKVVALYYKGYDLFSVAKATSVPKALVGILFEDINPADMSEIEKVRAERKILILKRKYN